MKYIRPITLTDAMLTAHSVAETDYTAWNGATAYTAGNHCILVNTHRIYERLISGTTATSPHLDATNWLDTGPTNRWAMFDKTIGTVTSSASPITCSIVPGEVTNSVGLMDIVATAARLKMKVGGVYVYDKTITIYDNAVILDWEDYFFTAFEPDTTAFFYDLPFYSTQTLELTVSHTSTVEIGSMVFGNPVELGGIRYGAQVGIVDYSGKTTDVFGVTSVVQRGYAKRLQLQLIIDNTDMDRIVRELAAIRATPVVWIGSDEYSSLVVYGYYKDWGIAIAYPSISECSLTIEGLV